MELLKFSCGVDQFDANDFLSTKEFDRTLEESVLPLLLEMAICNTVIVHHRSDGEIEYNADSPDEAAFVQFAAKAGVRLIERGLTSLTVDVVGYEKSYDILATIPFNSDRKRMSLLVKPRNGDDAVLYCKGADNMIQGLSKEFTCQEVINNYAASGLRTLVFAQRFIPDSELDIWVKEYQEAESSLADRDRLVEECGNKIEINLDVVGVSGVEDRLQPNVPETIQWLRRASVKVWVLTGDKLETAIAIGRTSGIIVPNSDVVIVASDKDDIVKHKLDVIKRDLNDFNNPVFIVTADAVEICLEKYFEQFMEIADKCESVILSRVSPYMKARVTSAVRNRGGMTLSIGDGANDVSMIQTAHVGVGVYGREGSQAAQSADFAIPRFKHLIRLLTIHGHWSYYRFSNVAMIMLFKNFMFIFAQFWFSLYNLWSPTSYYYDFFMSIFNLVYTVLPPFVFGCLEQDVPGNVLIENPDIYHVEHDPMKVRNLLYYLVVSIYQSLCAYYGTILLHPDGWLKSNGFITYHTVVYIAVFQVINWSSYANIFTFIFYAINILFVPVISTVYIIGFNPELQGIVTDTLAQGKTWFGFIISVITAVLPPYIIEYFAKYYHPSKLRIFAERNYLEKLKKKKIIDLHRQPSQVIEMFDLDGPEPHL